MEDATTGNSTGRVEKKAEDTHTNDGGGGVPLPPPGGGGGRREGGCTESESMESEASDGVWEADGVTVGERDSIDTSSRSRSRPPLAVVLELG